MFKAKSHQPASALKTIPISWPFAVWGLDMVGPFKRARSGMTHLLVAVDKFTKWIESRPIKKLDGPTVVRFVAIWCADMVYPIASSPTTAQILRKGRWPDTHLSKAFGLIWHQLHILSRMVKWREQMDLFCQASDPD